jgi:hypothetical protein
MFGNPLRALTVACVMTLLAFPAGATNHVSRITLDLENWSMNRIQSMCIVYGDFYGLPDECSYGMDWDFPSSRSFSIACYEQYDGVEFEVSYSHDNGDHYSKPFRLYSCAGASERLNGENDIRPEW